MAKPTKYGIDLGEILTEVEDIKQKRNQNALVDYELENLKKRKEMEPQINALKNQALNGLNADDKNGQTQDALQQLTLIDPEEQKAFIDAVSKMSENQKAQAKANVEEIAKMVSWVYDTQNEEDAGKRLNYVLSQLPNGMRQKEQERFKQSGMTPRQYADFYIRKTLALKDIIDQMNKNPEISNWGSEQIMQKNGKIIARTKSQAAIEADRNRTEKTTESGSITTAEENLIIKQVAAFFEGIYDPITQTIKLDDETDRPVVHAIVERAIQYYSDNKKEKGGKAGVAWAASKAARDFNVPIPKGPKVDLNDPAVIRKILMGE